MKMCQIYGEFFLSSCGVVILDLYNPDFHLCPHMLLSFYGFVVLSLLSFCFVWYLKNRLTKC